MYNVAVIVIVIVSYSLVIIADVTTHWCRQDILPEWRLVRENLADAASRTINEVQHIMVSITTVDMTLAPDDFIIAATLIYKLQSNKDLKLCAMRNEY